MSGEHLDRNIRQALDSVSHTLPPDTSYTLGRGWDRIRTELAADTPKPVPAHRRLWWRVAAIILFGFGAGITGLYLLPVQNGKTAHSSPESHAPLVSQQVDAPDKLPAKPDAPDRPRPDIQRQPPLATKPATPPDTLTKDGITATEARPQLAASPETVPEKPDTVSEKPVDTHVITAVINHKPVAKKRRFAVIHENELPLAEEAHRIRYSVGEKPERLVRIGSGAFDAYPSNQTPATLSVPLNRKTP
ncbi:hypothetical protein BLX24_08720 [Arsenicibacter rosenii]|uniref:Uncharacterized protein n=2 Tax=Arsenicibacter rosenii TaxID=1750698 RepID=A0A1S2VQ41_9BACT|nr:hypothetical protein BLX24_08720 [Arsenicibacter rosenii]